jgi:very-short-patch-repair endonuclease
VTPLTAISNERAFAGRVLDPRSPERICEAIAGRQHGVISRGQALDACLTPSQIKWRLRSGRWLETQPRVYLMGGVPRTSRGELMAACLWAAPTAIASHRAAGDLWGLAGVEPGVIEIAVDKCLRSKSVVVHRLPFPIDRVLHRESIPVADPTTTVFQLAAVLPEFRLEVALDCALRLKLTHVGLLDDRLDRVARSGRNGIVAIRRLLAERDPDEAPTASTLEDLLDRLIRRFELPRPVRQFNVCDGRGRFVARPDFAYPSARVAVEAQSYAYHHDRQQWEQDHRRLNSLVALGWRVVYVTARQMRQQPEVVAAQIRSALEHGARHQF